MTTTVNDLVREGRVTPKDGAMLLELREELQSRRDHQRTGWLTHAAVGFGVFVLALLGVRRYG